MEEKKVVEETNAQWEKRMYDKLMIPISNVKEEFKEAGFSDESIEEFLKPYVEIAEGFLPEMEDDAE